jgi:hypothetical protein
VAALILGCGTAVTSGDWQKLAASRESRVVETPATPGRSDVDPLVKDESIDRLVVHGTDADLAAVVLRLMRLERLDVPVGFVPLGRGSAVARLWELPAAPIEVALTGGVRRLPLIRDDAGGVLLGLGVLAPARGTVYCDDQLALRGAAERIEVAPDPDGELTVRVVRRGFLRNRTETFAGRAVQFGVDPVAPTRDGVAYPRPMERWTWYRHTEDLLVCSGVVPARSEG